VNNNEIEKIENTKSSLEVLPQLANAEIAWPDVVTRVRTRDLTVLREFNFSGLPFHLRPENTKSIILK
jgi:hypothetical protein